MFALLFKLLTRRRRPNTDNVLPVEDKSLSFTERCYQILANAWVEKPGYTSPNPWQYPWQWLWDSCFHAIAWSALGVRRCVTELESLFSGMLPSGFLPNTLYHAKPNADRWLWWTSKHSTITQPPMYGHALSVLSRRGFNIDHLIGPASKAMHHLIDSRLDSSTGLVKVIHPWETGCDDSPRWNRWMPFGYHRKFWNVTKYLLVRSMRVVAGEGVSNRFFTVCSASFNALVAFNALELAELTGDAQLKQKAQSIALALEAVWDDEKETWADVSPGGRVSSSVPTLESLLPLLVVSNQHQVDKAWAQLMNTEAFLRPFGFAGVDVTDDNYNPEGYWRGGSWPQIVYLLWVAAVRSTRPEAEHIAELALSWFKTTDFAEFSNPETGQGLGANPQSWAAVLIELFAR